jgi:tripartite-type tricarboxylate transporter receptor subunit TctC
MRLRTWSLRRVYLLLLWAFLACTAQAQTFPSRPMSITVAYAAGGGTDMFARVLAEGLSQKLGQPVVVENVPGAGGTIAVTKVSNAKPDGHALTISNGLEFEMQRMAEPTPGPERTSNLTPIALLGTQPMILVSRNELGFRTVDDVVQAAKKQPGKLSLATSGPGTSLYLAGSMFEKAGDVELIRVPYKSAPQIVNDLLSGNVDIAILALPSAMTFIKNGKLTAIAVTDVERSPVFADVPSIGDTPQFKGFDTKIWYALQGPPGLPSQVVDIVGDAVRSLLTNPDFVAKMGSQGITPSKTGTAAEFVELKNRQYVAFRKALGLPDAR